MANTTLIASVTGIGVAGVVGPMVMAWATRRANRQQFERDQAAKRRADLRDLIDEASVLLGAGATNLRIAQQAVTAGEREPDTAREWASNVHLLKQRLLLRLPPRHPIIERYEAVQDALEAVGRAVGDDQYDDALQRFEASRTRFLDSAREALRAPIGKDD